MLTCDVIASRGLVLVSGLVPNGKLTVQRQVPSSPTWFTLRGGSNMDIVTGGFDIEDSEAPLGVPLTYRALSTPIDRIAQRNLVMSPDFSLGAQTWTAGASRTLTIVGGKGHVTSNPAGTGAGVPGRTIAEVGVASLVTSKKYLVTGMIKFSSPAVWTWTDAKAFGTWSTVKAAKASWQVVRSTESDPGAVDAYNSVHISLTDGVTDYVAPIQVINVSMAQSGVWITFSAYITTPSVMSSASRLRILHGTSVREYAASWDLDKFSISTEEDASHAYRLFWFNGNTPVPDRPQDYLMQNSEWEDYDHNSTITWEGVVGSSASRFTVSTRIYTIGKCQIEAPDDIGLCEPVLLSDPVASALSQWFGLAEMGSLQFSARSTVFAPLGRDYYVSSSSVRGSATGSLMLFTNTLTERQQALTVFASGRVLLLRNPDPSYPESNWYIACGDIEESRTLPNSRRPERTWVVPYTTVERPTGLIEASAGATWLMQRNTGSTWQQLKDQNQNWLDVLQDAP